MIPNYEDVFTKERNDHFRAGGLHSGNYKNCKTRFNLLLRELEEKTEPSRKREIEEELDSLAKQVENYYIASIEMKMDTKITKEEFRKNTLEDIRTKLSLQYLGEKYQKTHETYVRWLDESSFEENSKIQDIILNYVHSLWEKAF